MGRRRQASSLGPHGVLLIDKPVGPSSREVLDLVSRKIGLGTSGHCGTLDPLASGLLVVAAGGATRLQELLTGHDKHYQAGLVLGASSATDDSEGPIQYAVAKPPNPTEEDLRGVLAEFSGPIKQKPPAFSAIRVGGERLYKRARKGEKVETPERDVIFHEITLTAYAYPGAKLEVRCGAGAYIRSLARDVGTRLGHGGYLGSLRRTACGWFDVSQAKSPDEVELSDLLSMEEAFGPHPSIEIGVDDLDRFLSGIVVKATAMSEQDTRERLAFSGGKLIARAIIMEDGLVRMRRIIRT